MSNGEPVDEILLTEGCLTTEEADDDLVSDRMVVFLTIVVMTLVVLMVTLVVKNALKKPPSPQAMIAAAIKEWAPGQGPQPFMYHPAAQTQALAGNPAQPAQPDWRRLPQAGPVTAAVTAGVPAPWAALPSPGSGPGTGPGTGPGSGLSPAAGQGTPAWNPLPGGQPNLAAGQIPFGSGSGPIRAYTGPTR